MNITLIHEEKTEAGIATEKVHCYKCNRWVPAQGVDTIVDAMGRTRRICPHCRANSKLK